MTADVFQTTPYLPPLRTLIINGKLGLLGVIWFFVYTIIFLVYGFVFVVAFLTVGFLEIRQANMVDFNALIAVLDQRDRYNEKNYLAQAIEELKEKRDDYKPVPTRITGVRRKQ